MSKQTRKRIYQTLTALGAVAVFYGLVTQDEVQLWLAVLLPWLGNLLAERNTHPE